MDVADQADGLIEAQRSEGIRRAASAVAGVGSSDCEACDGEIEPERRYALPSARRCITCQEAAERDARRQRQ